MFVIACWIPLQSSMAFYGVEIFFNKLLAHILTALPFTSQIYGRNHAACSWDFMISRIQRPHQHITRLNRKSMDNAHFHVDCTRSHPNQILVVQPWTLTRLAASTRPFPTPTSKRFCGLCVRWAFSLLNLQRQTKQFQTEKSRFHIKYMLL